MEGWCAEEVDVLMERLAGEVEPDRAMELIEAGVEPLNTLMARPAHQADGRRARARRGDGDGADSD